MSNASESTTILAKIIAAGPAGKDGKTPVNGVDYLTSTEIEALMAQAKTAVNAYTKQESHQVFANAVAGTATGETVALTDIQPGTGFSALTLLGRTLQSAAPTPAIPVTPAVSGAGGSITVTVENGSATQTALLPLGKPLYAIPNGSGGWTARDTL